ncbi:glycosyltransferase [Candidatus Woesearchaeota archaeon]|jgi:glycosyltransferase involved in cell wall biosynthesis|nr:glycosyltransferase [Candidatus Woesearchaeota archaeon]
MNLLVIAPPTLPVPPFEGYGGTQRGIHDFLKYMPAHGHKIHLIAPGDSDVSDLENVILHPGTEFATRGEHISVSERRKLNLEKEYRMNALFLVSDLITSEKIDLINSRLPQPDFLNELKEGTRDIPVVTSLHTFNSSPGKVKVLNRLGDRFHFTAHCFNHMAQYGDLQNVQVLPYGIDVSAYPYSPLVLSQADSDPGLDVLRNIKENGKDYFIIVGRISQKKGQKTAIELVLNETDDDIIIAGTPIERGKGKGGSKYLRDQIEPYLESERVHYFGNANEDEKKDLLKYSKGFLFLSGFEDRSWKEPFGRVIVEAMACGVPVLAFNYGSATEIVDTGNSGFLFDNLEEAKSLIGHLSELERYSCRQGAETSFDAKRVASDYHKLFTQVVGN